VVALSNALTDPPSARKFGHASLGLSITGLVTGIVAIIAIIVYFTSLSSTSNDDRSSSVASCPYMYLGSCYNRRQYVGGEDGYCYGIKSSTGFCYYD